ncbi:hypothetical protein HK405_001736, partial [Cladochytrium tenue]
MGGMTMDDDTTMNDILMNGNCETVSEHRQLLLPFMTLVQPFAPPILAQLRSGLMAESESDRWARERLEQLPSGVKELFTT